jgi:hypothetical protein
MPFLLVLQEIDIQSKKLGGLSSMLKKSSNSVQIFYPRFDKEQVIQQIRRRLEQLKKELDISLLVLFGSYAKGNFTVASDIDLLIVYRGNERKDAYALIKKTINIPKLEPHAYTERSYKEMEETIERMIEDGIVLFKK